MFSIQHNSKARVGFLSTAGTLGRGLTSIDRIYTNLFDRASYGPLRTPLSPSPRVNDPHNMWVDSNNTGTDRHQSIPMLSTWTRWRIPMTLTNNINWRAIATQASSHTLERSVPCGSMWDHHASLAAQPRAPTQHVRSSLQCILQ